MHILFCLLCRSHALWFAAASGDAAVAAAGAAPTAASSGGAGGASAGAGSASALAAPASAAPSAASLAASALALLRPLPKKRKNLSADDLLMVTCYLLSRLNGTARCLCSSLAPALLWCVVGMRAAVGVCFPRIAAPLSACVRAPRFVSVAASQRSQMALVVSCYCLQASWTGRS